MRWKILVTWLPTFRGRNVRDVIAADARRMQRCNAVAKGIL
jgi:hypothetical protein